MTNRRAFIKSGALAVFGVSFGGVPAFIARAASAAQLDRLYRRKKILICIFQRGAMDGLMAVSPFNDDLFKTGRPNLFMSAAQHGNANPLLDLDGRFGLHPSMASLFPLFTQKQLAVVHGIGSPNNTRSHFDAQDYMESGTPFDKGTSSGWLNRAIGLLGHDATPLRAVSITSSAPRSLYGNNASLTVNNLRDLSIRKGKSGGEMNMNARSFEELYDQTAGQLFQSAGKEAFEAVGMLSAVNKQKYVPTVGVNYPVTNLGNSMKQLAQLIKADVGLEIGFAESAGWDTHYNQGTTSGPFSRSAAELANSISAFWTDIGAAYQDDVTIMTMTEFGRTVRQNGTGGTDHGRASCNFILGNDVKGGKVYGDVPELAKENLEDGRDLPVTTDFRSVFSEVADKHLGLKNDLTLFPGWQGSYKGVMY